MRRLSYSSFKLHDGLLLEDKGFPPGSDAASVHPVNLKTGEELKQFQHRAWDHSAWRDHSFSMMGATLSDNNDLLLSWSDDGIVQLWNLDVSEPIERRELEWKIQTATTMNENGEIRALKYDEWILLREELRDYGITRK